MKESLDKNTYLPGRLKESPEVEDLKKKGWKNLTDLGSILNGASIRGLAQLKEIVDATKLEPDSFYDTTSGRKYRLYSPETLVRFCELLKKDPLMKGEQMQKRITALIQRLDTSTEATPKG